MPGITIVGTGRHVPGRAIKNDEERKLMRYAGWIASEGVKAGLEAIKPGATEYEVYGAFMGRMYELGSEGEGFYPFLASGPRARCGLTAR